jgi:hypothetical protein
MGKDILARFKNLVERETMQNQLEVYWCSYLDNDQRKEFRPFMHSIVKADKRCKCVREPEIGCSHTHIDTLKKMYRLITEGLSTVMDPERVKLYGTLSNDSQARVAKRLGGEIRQETPQGVSFSFNDAVDCEVLASKIALHWRTRLNVRELINLLPRLNRIHDERFVCGCDILWTCYHTDYKTLDTVYKIVVEGMPELLEPQEDRIVTILHGIADRAEEAWLVGLVRNTLFLNKSSENNLKDIAQSLVSSDNPPKEEQLAAIQKMLLIKKDEPLGFLLDAYPRLSKPQREIVWGVLDMDATASVITAFEKATT